MKSYIKPMIFLSVALLSTYIPTINASTISTWNLSGVAFDDGATAAGHFVVDNSASTVLSFHIETTGGSTITAFTYDNSLNSIIGGNNLFNAFDITFAETPISTGVHVLTLAFGENLYSTNNKSVSLLSGMFPGTGNPPWGSIEFYNFEGIVRNVTAGELTLAQVPEPTTIALIGLGLAGMGYLRRQRVQA